MLENKKVNIILALIVAIVLWAYVLGEVNPETTVTVKDVPINFLNQDMLEDTGYTILSSSAYSVNITISGQRTAATKVKPGDFTVAADVEALRPGENTVRVFVSGPDGVKIESVNVEKITVTVDKLVSREKEIKTEVSGVVENDKEVYVVEQGSDTVTVSGAETLIEKITVVKAVVEADKIGESMETIDADLTAVDKNGLEVSNVKLSQDKIKVTAVLFNKKTVHLDVPVINQNEGDIERSVTCPKTVVIKGTEKNLSNIEKISCRTLDVGGITETTSVPLEPVLPEGIQLADESNNLSANVSVKTVSKVQFDFTDRDIQLINREDGLDYSIGKVSFKVEVSGKESILETLDSSDITISADVKNLGKGTQYVSMDVTCSKGVSSLKTTLDKVEIIVE